MKMCVEKYFKGIMYIYYNFSLFEWLQYYFLLFDIFMQFLNLSDDLNFVFGAQC